MRILLQNLQSGANISKGYWQLPLLYWKYLLPHSQKPIERLAGYIKDENIDACAFTEADAGSVRTRYTNEVKFLSEKSGLGEEWFFQTTHFGKMTNQGNAFVSRYPLLETDAYRLPGKGEARYLCRAVFKTKRKTINLFVTHLSLGKKDRISQMKEIDRIVGSTKGTRILTGDFNISDEKELENIDSLKRISFLPTYPSWNPKKILDNIFISDDIKKYNLSTTKIRMSDHLGLVLEM